jgi:hypothetical protein
MDGSTTKKEIVEIIDNITKEVIRKIQHDIKINNGDVIKLITYVLILVEKIQKPLTSEEKLYIATKVTENTIDEIPHLTEQDKKDIKQLIPNTIEIIVEASKGKFSFGKKKKTNKQEVNTVDITRKIYKRLRKLIKDDNYDAKRLSANIFILLTQVMSMVDEYPYLSGQEKKEISTTVFSMLLNDIDTIFPDMTEEDKTLLIMSVRLLSPMIDNIIDGIRGKIDINKVKNWFSRTFEKCKCSCKK